MHPCSKRCSVPGCKSTTEIRHRFPKNDPALFQKWIDQVNSSKLSGLTTMQIYHRHRVCHRHFSEEFRVTLPSRTGIRANAYPTLFLSESQLIYKDVNGNNENINLNNLPSCSSAVNVISPNKEVLQEEQQSQCSIKETPRKGKINKMKVKICTQVFSYTVASHLVTFSKWKDNLPNDAEQTGAVIAFLDGLFDSCNSSSKTAPEFKPLLEALSLSSPHEEFWSRAIYVFKQCQILLPC
ncbi:uncharacterized protein LOC143204636 isoform X4 [Rhynchophorus ferrugineus]|uniref:uncharacterized protein LOC143204636 isoform X4 n=1 Tax=Rhynchophorus ferrugineus TaxID=354439 RepID=UPI003FCD9832